MWLNYDLFGVGWCGCGEIDVFMFWGVCLWVVVRVDVVGVVW